MIGGLVQSFPRELLPPLRELLPPLRRSPSLDEGGLWGREAEVGRISAGARCAPLQRCGNRNCEMRLQRWVASLQPSVAPPSPVGARIARPFISDVITTFREGARRVIGATAKPLYPIDGKAVGLDRRTPQTSLFEGGGPPAGGGRSYQAVEGVNAGGRMSRPSGARAHERLRSLPPPPLFWWFISFSAYIRWSARMRISAAAALSSG